MFLDQFDQLPYFCDIPEHLEGCQVKMCSVNNLRSIHQTRKAKAVLFRGGLGELYHCIYISLWPLL